MGPFWPASEMCIRDRFFPDLDALPQWSVVERSPLQEENGVTYQYINYQNAAPKLLAERKSL